ncbi:MAG: trypsin-like serine protease [Deltaproteobacteria bacterium]|nr:trypsin-like serine protease [Deltaproteobacteria bacterium]
MRATLTTDTSRQGRLLSGAVAAAMLLASVGVASADLSRPRIVNGDATQAYPSTGALVTKDGAAREQICTGTMIGCETFLTAAHCVCDGSTFASCGTLDPSDYQVFLQNVGFRDVASIAVHPSFDFGDESDVAVLKLAAPASGVPPTPINTTGTPPYGTEGVITGFGVTDGSGSDSGLKRVGLVETSSCDEAAPEPEHVCWDFRLPLGAPGTDSNTCYGDSGGPLFVDFGAGPVVAGITSGGVAATCRANDVSYDANVYANRAFIQGSGGADLANTSCGAFSQVGDGDTEVTTIDDTLLTTLPSAARACRGEVARRYRKYLGSALRARQHCFDRVNRGNAAGPCPDATALVAIQKATEELAPSKIAKKCPSSVIPAIGAIGACTGADTPSDLSSCIEDAADATIAQLLDLEYADTTPSGTLPPGQSACQAQIGLQLGTYATKNLKVGIRCLERQDAGLVASCPDTATQAKLALFAARAQSALVSRCSNAQVSGLDAAGTFGGSCAGASTATGLASCELAEHADLLDDHAVLAPFDPATSATTSVAVAAGTARLHFVLNGVEDAADVDLYVRRGAPPTPSNFDASSTFEGTFEAIEVTSPAAGNWYVRVEIASGTNPEYQLTITEYR